MTTRNDLEFRTHDQVAGWYDAKYTEMGGGWITPTHELDHHLRVLVGGIDRSSLTGASLLDLGCGDGQFVFWAANYPFDRIVGVDISPVACEMARERTKSDATRVRIVQTSMEDPRGEDGASITPPGGFDYVISLGSLEHCLDIPAGIRTIARSLRRGGRYLIYVPNELWIHRDQPLETTMAGEEWKSLLTMAGLHVEAVVQMNDNNQIVGWK